MSKNLIKVYCNKERYLVCDCCDSMTEQVLSYYKIAEPKHVSDSCRRYLDCCKHKVGTVIDWEEESNEQTKRSRI